MPLQRGEVLGYDFNRMVVDFTMINQGKTVRCAISTAAMDDLEGKHDVKADQAELKRHSKAKSRVSVVARAMKRTPGALRQQALKLGIGLGHRR